VEEIAPDDIQAIAKTPWLSEMFTPNDCSTDYSDLIQHWSASGAILLGLRARLVTANEFNQHCGGGLNKSDLLSSVTLALVRTMLERTHAAAENEPVTVFCDRHGGRRYYASALQSQFDGSLIRVVEETQRESRYRVPFGEHDFQIRFTVKGDSFPPVAFSSVVAKYMRELAMESLNSYFQKHHTGAAPLRPTAGYPQDADRFLADVSETVKRLAIPSSRLIRCR
jgi:hypothetical protein